MSKFRRNLKISFGGPASRMGTTLDKARIGEGVRVYAIGDVHGCLDQVRAILGLIDDDLSNHPINRYRVIFLGDYIDRGPAGPETIEFLINLSRGRSNLTLLKGNHDKGFVDFVSREGRHSTMFFRYGGASTLRQYGVDIPKTSTDHEWKEAAPSAEILSQIVAEAVEKVDPRHLNFLNSLPYFTDQDDFFFCHAGIRPRVPLENQNAHDLIWIRDDFLSYSKPHEKVVIHGHTSRFNVDVQPNRINIDTRCHDTGRLTCLVLESTHQRFLQTGG